MKKEKQLTLERAKGEEYLPYKKTVVTKKKCRLQCDEYFDEDKRAALLYQFYKLDVNALQKYYKKPY